ncbi:MAG: heparinase, partial [Bacteroidaceae bacterium]|nr:heparinase [Bacteroidaceae bacterium]
VTYEEGTDPADSKELFIGYGSALRRANTSYFSSYSKLFVIKKDTEKGTEIQMEGQPNVTARFKTDKRPANLILNGKKSSFIYKDKSMTVSNK